MKNWKEGYFLTILTKCLVFTELKHVQFTLFRKRLSFNYYKFSSATRNRVGIQIFQSQSPACLFEEGNAGWDWLQPAQILIGLKLPVLLPFSIFFPFKWYRVDSMLSTVLLRSSHLISSIHSKWSVIEVMPMPKFLLLWTSGHYQHFDKFLPIVSISH